MSAMNFPALLKYWRGRHGLSQLDMALEAGISPRHLSYLETGRARPSEAMVLRLMRTLNVSLRQQDEALAAAGFPPRFTETDSSELPAEIQSAIAHMLRQHEPFPLMVMSADYRILQRNAAASRLLETLVRDRDALASPTLDMAALVLDPRLAREAFCDWEAVAQAMISRLQRELLRSADQRLAVLLDRALGYPGVSPRWRYAGETQAMDAVLPIRLQHDGIQLRFLTTLARFSAPGMAAVEEIQLESYFPLDDATRHWCHQSAGERPGPGARSTG